MVSVSPRYVSGGRKPIRIGIGRYCLPWSLLATPRSATSPANPPKGRNIRKRRSGSADAEEDGDEEMSQSSAAAADDDDDDGASAAFFFESSKEIQVQNDSRATATLETEAEFTRDARAIREKTLKLAAENLKGKARSSGEEKLDRGIHGYTDHEAGFRREQAVAGEKAGGVHGPLRAPLHIRVSARFDYQPDICKDFKETGYCGYGDACKFMHDRGDYKMGWQLEREWEETEKARKRALAMGGVEDGDEGIGGRDDDDDELPFACFICRQPFEDPVVTKCKRYFCEHCVLKVYPLVAAMTFVGGMIFFQLSRNALMNPDVRINKANRSTAILENAQEGEKYAKHSLREFLSDRRPEIFPSINKFFAGRDS